MEIENIGPHEKAKTESARAVRVFRSIIGFVLFGALMGIRTEFESPWTRTLVAAIAGAALAICVLPMKKRKQ
jgi:hypothetical protein